MASLDALGGIGPSLVSSVSTIDASTDDHNQSQPNTLAKEESSPVLDDKSLYVANEKCGGPLNMIPERMKGEAVVLLRSMSEGSNPAPERAQAVKSRGGPGGRGPTRELPRSWTRTSLLTKVPSIPEVIVTAGTSSSEHSPFR